jgi:iron complex transport system substrate-binding protein
MRICSLLPSATEICFALGLGDQVVGVSHECDYPPEVAGKAVLVASRIRTHDVSSGEIDRQASEAIAAGKGVYAIDREALRRAAPDLVLTQELCDVCAVPFGDVVEAIRALPHPPAVISLNPTTVEDVLRDIRRVGEVAGRVGEAAAFSESLRKRVEAVRERAAGAVRRPRVFCCEWMDPLYGAGHWIPEMVEWAAGQNGLGTARAPSVKVEWEAVRAFAPEVLVVMPCGFGIAETRRELALLTSRPGWSERPAVRDGNVYAVNGHAYFNRSGPRLVDGLEVLARLVHPERFPGPLDPEVAVPIG